MAAWYDVRDDVISRLTNWWLLEYWIVNCWCYLCRIDLMHGTASAM